MKNYSVTFEVIFLKGVSVEAKNKKEAIEEARKEISYGEGEEVKFYEIEETS